MNTMTMKIFFRPFALLALPALLLVAGCDRHDDDEHFGLVDRIEVTDREDGTLYAFYNRDQDALGFQVDEVLAVPVGEEIALDVRFRDVHGQWAELGAGQEYELGARIHPTQGQPGIVELSAHGDHVDIEGVAPGQTHIQLRLMHGGHSDHDSPPLAIQVN
jgi:hypothetical protein